MREKNNTKETNQNKDVKANELQLIINNQSNGLIYFDKRVKIFLAIMIMLYTLLSLGKIHTSSVAMWDRITGAEDSKSVLYGIPQPIRQDEWMVNTPGSLDLLPLRKSNIRQKDDGHSLKLSDLSLILHPHKWIPNLLPSKEIERKFSFNWNFSIFYSIVSFFLLLMLLTKNNFWLSMFGAFILFFSSGVQWWSYLIAILMMWANTAFISAIYILKSNNKKLVLLYIWIFVLSSYHFVTDTLYPAWQVPLGYFYISIFVGIFVQDDIWQILKKNIGYKLTIVGITLCFVLFYLYGFYDGFAETAKTMMATVYPGRRMTNGGDLVKGKMFSEFFGTYLSAGSHPGTWLNICEVSSTLMVFPIVFYGMVRDYILTKKLNWLIICLSIYILILVVWILVGFPSIISNVTLFTMSPVYRTLPILGVTNLILLVIFLANRPTWRSDKYTMIEWVVMPVVIISFITLVVLNIQSATSSFFSTSEVFIVIALMSLIYVLIAWSNFKYFNKILVFILLGLSLNYVLVNPVTMGLSAILGNPLVQETGQIKSQDPDARWAVYGSQRATNLLKTNQINVLNGLKPIPPFADLKILDPSGRYENVYNRYAHIAMYYHKDAEDNVYFQLNENEVVNDSYTIIIHPCSENLVNLKVKYFMFDYPPTSDELRCLTLVLELGKYSVYKRNGL